ncbi:hypothetical protein BDD12DRAFT_263176 [Trichophaea hybrida]|nr:hypothetical protein BDD12DRAFT_263176 [Trichophaea hybrida]
MGIQRLASDRHQGVERARRTSRYKTHTHTHTYIHIEDRVYRVYRETPLLFVYLPHPFVGGEQENAYNILGCSPQKAKDLNTYPRSLLPTPQIPQFLHHPRRPPVRHWPVRKFTCVLLFIFLVRRMRTSDTARFEIYTGARRVLITRLFLFPPLPQHINTHAV